MTNWQVEIDEGDKISAINYGHQIHAVSDDGRRYEGFYENRNKDTRCYYESHYEESFLDALNALEENMSENGVISYDDDGNTDNEFHLVIFRPTDLSGIDQYGEKFDEDEEKYVFGNFREMCRFYDRDFAEGKFERIVL